MFQLPSLPDQVIFTNPSDVGWGCVSRHRAFTILLRHDAGRFIREPQQVYDRLCSGLGDSQLPFQALFGLTSDAEIQAELTAMRKLRGNATGLTETEYKNLVQYQKVCTKQGEPKDLQVYALNQNPGRVFKAARNGILPLLTATDKLLWVRSRDGPLLPKEKLLAHGYPMSQELSDALKIPVTWCLICCLYMENSSNF